MVLEKNRQTDDVLFIDASKGFEKQKNSNKLRQEDIDKIVETYLSHKDVDKYAHVASMEEIKSNDYNLNIPRYVDTFEPEPEIDIAQVKNELSDIDQQLTQSLQDFQALESQLVKTDPQDEQINNSLQNREVK